MKAGTALKRGLAQIGRLWRSETYAEALEQVNRLLEISPDNPPLLIMRAQLIPLLDDGRIALTLEDAKADLKRAAALDDQSPVPLIELGYFTYAVEDDARASLTFFRKAVAQCKDLLQEALIGQAKALTELDRQPEALACLAEAYALRGNNGPSEREAILEQFRTLSHS